MELKAEYTFDAPPGRVWDLLMDPQAIAACLPGCQRFDALGDDRYQVVLTAGVAAITGSFSGTVAIVDKQPHASYRLVVEGRGTPGFANGESRVTLRPANGGVSVEVAGTVNVGGLIAQVGQRLLGATARLMLDRFFKCLQARLAQHG
jgi:carbon monoxide dehydrogenase subunit G